MVYFRMNLYILLYNNGVFKDIRDKEIRKELINKAIRMTLKETGLNMLDTYTYDELEAELYNL